MSDIDEIWVMISLTKSIIEDNNMIYVNQIIDKSNDIVIVVSLCFLEKDQLYKII